MSHTGNPTSPLNPRISSTLNQPSSSHITLDWEAPSSTGGVSIRYVLIISPTSLSGSPVTVDTTLAQITVSYNVIYNVTIRAVNCAGMNETKIVNLGKLIKRHVHCISMLLLLQLCAPHRLLLLVLPSSTHLQSLLMDPCSPSLAVETMK